MKKNILFVDDNPLLLQGYATMLEDERDGWKVSTAGDAGQALEMMKHSPFEVVAAELRLNGMNGTELMAEIKKRHPASSRIILADYSDQEEFARSLDATHQFIAKPFDRKTLKATLDRISGLNVFLQDEKLRSLASRLSTVPSFPSLYVEIMKEVNAKDPSIDNIAAIISHDPSMTAKTLQAVNSAMFGLPRQISSPFEAVQFLGVDMVVSLALSSHAFTQFEKLAVKGFSIHQLWEHALMCALFARTILRAEGAGPGDMENGSTAAMLHDIGQLILAANLPDQFQQELALCEERQIPLEAAELEIFGATHAGTGAYLLGLWGLPVPIVEAVAFHHSPGNSDQRVVGPLAAVYAADVLEHQLSKNKAHGPAPEPDMAYLSAIGMADRFEVWRIEVEGLLNPQFNN